MATRGKRAQAAVAAAIAEIERQMWYQGRTGFEAYRQGVNEAEDLKAERAAGSPVGQVEYRRHLAVQKFTEAAHAYGMACAYAIALNQMLEGVGQAANWPYSRHQGHYAREASRAERSNHDLTWQGFSHLSNPTATPFMENPLEREIIEREQREAEARTNPQPPVMQSDIALRQSERMALRARMDDNAVATRQAIEAHYR